MEDNSRNPSDPLEAPYIRLLEIHPGSGTDPLRCRRICANLNSLPRYEALSYTWGNTQERFIITCDALPVSITTNLRNALSRLRLSDSSRRLWVDAICIDQSSNDEKAGQIPLMGRIFSTAAKVLVWLGEIDPGHSAEASVAIQFIATACRNFEKEVGFKSGYEEYSPLQWPAEELGPAAVESLTLLYATPWFTRVWCVQEIAMATNSTIYWGEQEFLWRDVGLVAKYFFHTIPPTTAEYNEQAAYAIVPYSNAETLFRVNRYRSYLMELLGQFRGFSATDPRDKVYGLLSLVESVEEAESISIDYNKSVGEVYTDVARAMIQHHRDLKILAFVGHESDYQKREGFPSWAPEWDSQKALRRIPALASRLGAHGDSKVRILNAHMTNSYRLALYGLFYSEISFVYEEMNMFDLGSFEVHPFAGICTTLIDPEATKETHTLRFQCLARTLTAGLDARGYDVIFADSMAQQEFYQDSAQYLKSDFTADGDTRADDAKPLSFFYHEAGVVCSGRRVFRTANGSFGLGPGCMREKDIAVVLFGGSSVYILRPHGDAYLFMGQAYIDELMQGELVDAFEAGKVQEQAFCLV